MDCPVLADVPRLLNFVVVYASGNDIFRLQICIGPATTRLTGVRGHLDNCFDFDPPTIPQGTRREAPWATPGPPGPSASHGKAGSGLSARAQPGPDRNPARPSHARHGAAQP